MSPSLIALAATFGAAAGAFLPRIAHRLAVPAGAASRAACADSEALPRPPARDLRGVERVWPAVVSTALVAAILAAALGARPVLVVLLPAAVPGVLLAVIDVRVLRLPDPLVVALAVVTVGPLTAGALMAGQPGRLGRASAAAALFFLTYAVLAVLPRGPLGFGDVKLAAVLGFILGFVGWPAVVVGLLAPHLLNGPVALVLLVTGRARRDTALPFGPALLAGALIGVALYPP